MLADIDRKLIMKSLGKTIDEVVEREYSELVDGRSLVQEPTITDRICDRVEQKLDGQVVGKYKFRINAEALPDRGPGSAEKLLGADLALSVSLDGEEGFDKTLLIQAKYDREFDRKELIEASEKMQAVAGSKGTYIWVYTPEGVKVISPHQVRHMRDNDFGALYHRSAEGFTGRILDCYAGNRRLGIPKDVPDRKRYLRLMIERLRAKRALDIRMRRTDGLA